ncbi:hypothetical protein A2W14_04040 [Candidatus Gottesmanbacteria bacterium RBG_16_37_8]|uniref:EfeO-type cupredoxin-like domain-containing protein n=1 Tax=Candidatus Gottesmanbacteria bacterium RBG_16_37_8 TaxID=1798371 RepID=A0A1F5YUL8_9BACT|nr:MAG: hypothetical protein A2W14_04040 [Candidatus Gottesmanbacteria bacterium RBG_16_37_8]
MNKYLIGFIVVLLVAVGGYNLIKGSQTKVPSQTEVNEEQTETLEDESLIDSQEEEAEDAKESDEENEATQEDADVKTFNLDAINFSYNIKEIRVKKGTRVKINLVRKQGFHDLVIDEFNARTKQLGEGSEDSVEFVADKTGTFEYYCSVGQHRQQGMVGKLIVE